MSEQFTPEPEIWALFDAACGGALETGQVARLEVALRADERLCDIYLDYFRLHAELSRSVRLERTREKVIGAIRQPESVPSVPPIVLDLSSTSHYPLPAAPFVGSWAFSYIAATVILGMMLLGFGAYKITHYRHIAEAPSQSAPSEAMPEMVFVGRITGMVDVKWSDDPHYLPPPGYAYVPLGRKYKLDAGLMQITYDSGAKVILEGPCTYEVESSASGYLALGKLTARVGEDRETRRQGDKEKKADAASPHLLVSRSPGLPVSPLFSVRTPVAVVTDLGTEFGVEVGEEGITTSHVFRGKVKVQVLDGDGNLPSPSGRGAGGEGSRREVILGENESARVQHGKDGRDAAERLAIVRGPAVGKVDHFVRSLPTKPPSALRSVAKSAGPGFGVGAVFEQNPPERYVNVGGSAVYEEPPWAAFEHRFGRRQNSRSYLRTVETDFCNRDFVFEATFHVELDDSFKSDGTHRIFFGIGDGVPGKSSRVDGVKTRLVKMFIVDSEPGRAATARLYDPDITARPEANGDKLVAKAAPNEGQSPDNVEGAVRRRFRMSKTGKWVTFALDGDFQGQFHQIFAGPPVDLPATAPLLNETNSRLLVGVGNCDTMTVRFEELLVTYPESNVDAFERTPALSGQRDGKEGTSMD